MQPGTPTHTVLALNAACLVFESLLKMGAGGAQLASSNSSTVSSVQQQLQQSGLLAQLPALLTAAAQSLEAAAAGSIADEAAARCLAQLALNVSGATIALCQDAWSTELCAPCIAPSMQLLAQCSKYMTNILTTTSSSNGDGSSGGSRSSSNQQQQHILGTLGSRVATFAHASLHTICVMACGCKDIRPRLGLLQALDPPLPNNQHFLEVLALQVAQVHCR